MFLLGIHITDLRHIKSNTESVKTTAIQKTPAHYSNTVFNTI